MIAGETCPLCGSPGIATARPHVRYCGCSKGGLLLSWLWSTEESYDRFYSDGTQYHEAQQISEGQKPYLQMTDAHYNAARSRLSTVEWYTKNQRYTRSLLDAGCGDGIFLDAAAVHGWDAKGIEPNPIVGSSSQRITVGSVYDIPGVFDVITLHDVFEHLTRPSECLSVLRSSLRCGGRLFIEMPEFDSPSQRAAGLTWKHIRPRQHLCLYSRDAAISLFVANGFDLDGFYRPLDGALGKATWVLK